MWIERGVGGEEKKRTRMERAVSLDVRGETSEVREALWAQQELLHKLRQELDAEREASASATSEALSMILRLQGEKAASEMEARQYKRMAEEKMCHAENSLALFEDLIYNKEMEIASLEFQVQAYRCRLLSLGCSDPSVFENKFPDTLMFFGESSSASAAAAAAAGLRKSKMNRVLSCPSDRMNNDRTLLLTGKEAMNDINIECLDEKKTPESSLSPPGDLNAYWEQIKIIDEHVREISDSRDPHKENKFSLPRRESMSHALVSQVSNTILETTKSDISYIMEKMKNADRLSARDASAESAIRSSNVQDIFEVPPTKESLAVVLEEGRLLKSMEKRSQKMNDLERRLSRPPRDMSFKTESDMSIKMEHLSLLKEIREQLNVIQSEMRSFRSEVRQSQQPESPPQEDRALQSIKKAMIHFWL